MNEDSNMPQYLNINYAKYNEQLMKAEEDTAELRKDRHDRFVISSEVIMYSVEDVMGITGWSRKVVQRLFRHPEFPSIDYGKRQLIEAHALIEFMSVKREKEKDQYWKERTKNNRSRKGGQRYV